LGYNAEFDCKEAEFASARLLPSAISIDFLISTKLHFNLPHRFAAVFLKFRDLETCKTSKTIYDGLDHANRYIRQPVVL